MLRHTCAQPRPLQQLFIFIWFSLLLILFTQHFIPEGALLTPKAIRGHQQTPQNPTGCLFYPSRAIPGHTCSFGRVFTWIVCPKRRTAPFLTGEIRFAREVTRAKGRTRFVLGSCKASPEQIVLAVPPSEISQAGSKKHKPT